MVAQSVRTSPLPPALLSIYSLGFRIDQIRLDAPPPLLCRLTAVPRQRLVVERELVTHRADLADKQLQTQHLIMSARPIALRHQKISQYVHCLVFIHLHRAVMTFHHAATACRSAWRGSTDGHDREGYLDSCGFFELQGRLDRIAFVQRTLQIHEHDVQAGRFKDQRLAPGLTSRPPSTGRIFITPLSIVMV